MNAGWLGFGLLAAAPGFWCPSVRQACGGQEVRIMFQRMKRWRHGMLLAGSIGRMIRAGSSSPKPLLG